MQGEKYEMHGSYEKETMPWKCKINLEFKKGYKLCLNETNMHAKMYT